MSSSNINNNNNNALSLSRNKSKKHSFQSDIAYMMEALGFDIALPETLDTLEDILITYIVDLYNEALRSSEIHGRTKVKFDDIKFAVRKDKGKLHRMDEISRNIKIINQNKKAFDSKNKQVKDLKVFEDSDGDVNGIRGVNGEKKKGGKNSSRKGLKYKKRKKEEVTDANGEPRKKRKYVKKAQREKEAREKLEAEQRERELAQKKQQGIADDEEDNYYSD
ncbi:Taf13 protein [Saccharomycopsis crataegensis]|uniref:Transcription initiation factor TFIID subunit 13 n=1 Tax=Saccharomycopsis crataegensis TaxID=43959 RepID=A0AAV5QGM0_9ASCO|nr:Taf13 protein [Saccharomycopsis crataegensis]